MTTFSIRATNLEALLRLGKFGLSAQRFEGNRHRDWIQLSHTVSSNWKSTAGRPRSPSACESATVYWSKPAVLVPFFVIQVPRHLASREQTHTNPEGEPADVRPPGDAPEPLAAGRQAQCTVKKLEKEPPAEEEHGRQNEIRPQEKGRYHCLYFRVRIESKISPHHARHRSA